ncbi:uncharacterized protein EDB93DRAFT_640310 [Suillus bovinus]|uniref:uncharacterized protein n=1 Tax=Suillus bovinus TaxID=48563 RepID=UPI001B86D307|nr:uncharacterized protein EDB93DRAFT_640310 [Suillus bovinus]KAG2141163.1 hypothetical protein EDB93DRAFT_640310 [Suillus bovinus]
MPVATNVSIPQPRSMVRRKPAPSIVLDARYPCPDPDDPFAPLSVLRTRTASTLGLLTFTGDSTSQLPTLPYTGGPFPPDPYQATPPASPDVTASPDKKLEFLTTFSTRSSLDIAQNLNDTAESGRWPPQFSRCDSPSIRTLPTPQRRRSRSAVSRKEARANTCPVSPGTSPYGHTNLQAYVLASSRFPSPTHSSQPLRMQHVGHGSESLLPLVIPITRHDSAPVLSLMSATSSSRGSPEPTHTSRSRVGKLARFLPRKSRSGLSLAEFPSETGNAKRHHHHRPFPSMTVTLGGSSERSSKEKHVPEENTFRPRRKSSMSMLFPAVVAANMQSLDVSYPSTATSIYDSPTSAEPGYMSEPSSSTLYSPSGIASGTSEPAPLTPKKPRPQTMQLQQRLIASNEHSHPPCKKLSSRPSTAPSNFAHVFDENVLPTKRQLLDAAACVVVAENGIRVPFGDLFRDQKTVVIFIRHFWCPLCQDYMFSITNTVDPQVLKQSGVNLVIISNGSYNMIKSYRQIFRTPFAVYTDPSSRIYGILGMTMKSVESKAEPRRSGYVRHSRAGGIAMVIANVLRVGMPVWEKAGDPTQLGGEFVLGPGMTASYAHRMRSRSSHAPIVRVLTAAGVHVYLHSEKPKPVVSSDPAGRASLVLEVDEEQWMEERRQSLARIRERKQARRLDQTCCESHDSN